MYIIPVRNLESAREGVCVAVCLCVYACTQQEEMCQVASISLYTLNKK